MNKIVECVPNFSEGRDLKKINKIADSARKVKEGVTGSAVKVLDVEWDKSHNRSLITIVGEPKAVFDAAFNMIKTATSLIDMEKHSGEHPRIGATDVVPFVPVSGVDISECIDLAKKLGKKVGNELKIPVYLYEAAAVRPDRVNLADVRRGQYEGLKTEIETEPSRHPDFGPAKMHPTAGAVVIGARKFLVAYNVNLETSDIEVAKTIARKIREKDGGLLGVKALGFEVGGYAQVSMNLVDFEKTNFDAAFDVVRKLAKEAGVEIKSSEIYGMLPLESLIRAIKTTFKAEAFKSDQVLEKKIFE